MGAERLDILVARLLGASRVEAQRIIKEGHVSVNAKILDKPGLKLLPPVENLVVKGGRRPYVGRGGEKLKAALDGFGVSVSGRVCLDVGASTGGFTDCLLKQGAACVYAVDNGVGQLDASLRQDSRVLSYEDTDIRNLKPGFFPNPIQLATVDVSFISLTKVLESIIALLQEDLICLIKPQFESGPGHTDKKGIIRDPAVRQAAIDRVTAFVCERGFVWQGVIPSPLLGGNQEYLSYFLKKNLS